MQPQQPPRRVLPFAATPVRNPLQSQQPPRTVLPFAVLPFRNPLPPYRRVMALGMVPYGQNLPWQDTLFEIAPNEHGFGGYYTFFGQVDDGGGGDGGGAGSDGDGGRG